MLNQSVMGSVGEGVMGPVPQAEKAIQGGENSPTGG